MIVGIHHASSLKQHFAAYLDEQYRIYRYEGALHDIESGVVVLCWPADESMEAKRMRCFFSTDIELTTQTILAYYSERWLIETHFKQVKGTLGFQGVQVRHQRAIEHYWLLVQFSYLFMGAVQQDVFSTAIHQMRRDQFTSIIEFVYNETRIGTSLEQIKIELLVA